MLVEYRNLVSIESQSQHESKDGLAYIKVSAYDEHGKLCDFFGYVPEDFALACWADEEMEYFEARGDDAKTLREGRSLIPFVSERGKPREPVPVPDEPVPDEPVPVPDEPVIIDGFVMPF